MAHGFGCKILYSGSRPKPEEAEPLGTGPYFFFFFGPCPRLDNKRWLTRGANGYDPGATYVPMDELLQRSDIVSVHCPLTPETRYTHNTTHNTHTQHTTHNTILLGCDHLARGLFGKEAFARMRSSAVFINTSRGPVVDQEALYDALASNTIAAAGLG